MTESRFSLAIEDVFQFEDGRCVLAGTMRGGEHVMVVAGPAQLWRDNEKVADFRIEGESLPSQPDLNRYHEKRAVSTRDDLALTREQVAQHRYRVEGLMRTYQPRHLIGIDSPPDKFVPDRMTLGPRLPSGWEGDAWTDRDESSYFLRAWNKRSARFAIGEGTSYEAARQSLLNDIEHGNRKAEVTVKESVGK